jgi:two-component system, NtrC family, nitrogen regulation sensor histidine kinase NtrY
MSAALVALGLLATASLAALVVALVALRARSTELAGVRAHRASTDAAMASARADLAQGDAMLRALGDHAPMAIVLFTERGRIEFLNREARELFFDGEDPGARADFLALLQAGPETLRRAVIAERDELFTVEEDGAREIYHLGKRHFSMGGMVHTLLMVRRLTDELGRQEIEAWRRIIRVMAHEVNNSLAPVSSLVHSGRVLAQDAAQAPKLERVFDGIKERAEHLRAFLARYAELARLPVPRRQMVAWGAFLERIGALFPAVRIELAQGGGEDAYFDPAQIEQVLINVIKNAQEAGGDPTEITLEAEALADGSARLRVLDRGQGLSDEAMSSLFVPFYSTKERGSGLGLSLCREIVEAHGGRLRLRNRDGGGAEVTVRLPGRAAPGEPPRVRLTLTRG